MFIALFIAMRYLKTVIVALFIAMWSMYLLSFIYLLTLMSFMCNVSCIKS